MFKQRKREGRAKTIFGGAALVIVIILGVIGLLPYLSNDPNLGIMSLLSYFEKEPTESVISGPRLYLTSNEFSRYRARPRFISEEDGFSGAEILGRWDDSAVAKLGLQGRDVVQAFNGTKIVGVIDFADALRRINQSTETITIEILRNGKPFKIIYNVTE